MQEAREKISEIQGFLDSAVQRSSCEGDPHKERLYLYMKDHGSVPLSSLQMVSGFTISLIDTAYILVCTLISVALHEFGHAIAAARTKVSACAKHFVGDGGTTKGINENNTVINQDGLLSIHMPAYYNSIIKGVSTVMVSYSGWNGKKMHANRDLITGFLKERLRFRGFVISDWQGIDRITSPPHSNYSYDVSAGVNAGVDMVPSPEVLLQLSTYNSVVGFERLAEFKNLKVLNLQNGHSDSCVLPSLSAITSLTTLDLYSNSLWFGASPESYGDLGKLSKPEVLNLKGNSLNNSILPFLGPLTSLKTLNLGENQLEGSLSEYVMFASSAVN